MSKFYVDSTKLRTSSGQILNIQRVVQNKAKDVQHIADQASSWMEGEDLKAALEEIVRDLEKEASSCDELQEALNRIADLYIKAETDILSTVKGANDASKGNSSNSSDKKNSDSQWEPEWMRKALQSVSKWYNNLPRPVREMVNNAFTGYARFMANTPFGKAFVHFFTGDQEREEKLFNLISDPVSRTLAFEYNAKDDFYRTNENFGVQRYGGFANMFDDVGGGLGMDLDTQVVDFEYNGKAYRVQFWKGSYGFGNAYGSEIGFYENDPNDDSGWYECANGEDEIRTRQTLIDTSTGESMTNDTADYAKDGDHFWNLMIRTDDGHEKENLTQESVLYFDSQEQAEAFIEGIKGNKYARERLQYKDMGNGRIRVIY